MNQPLMPWIIAAALLANGLHAETISSNLVDSPIQTVSDHNNGIASSLLGINPHPPSQPYGQGNPNSPLITFYANARTIMPSVDNRISANRAPYLVWSWARDQYPTIETGDTNSCGHQKIKMTYLRSDAFFTLYSQLAGTTKTTPYPGNPASLPYTTAELQNNAGNSLSAWISGQTSLFYKEQIDTVHCQSACGRGGCTTYVTIQHTEQTKQYTSGVTSNTISYTIAPYGMTDFLAAPFSNRQSYQNPQIAWLAFTNADAAKYYSQIDGKLYNASYKAKFSIYNDDQNVWSISKTPTEQIGLDPADAQGQNLPKITLENSMNTQSNTTAKTALDAIGLQGTFSHIYTFSHQIPDLQILGPHQYTFKLYDEFGDSTDKTYTITTVAPTWLKFSLDKTSIKPGETITATATLLDQNRQPLAGRQIQFKTAEYATYASTNTQGKATAQLTPNSPGPQTATASFTGDAQYAEKTESKTIKVQNTTPDNRISLALQSSSMQFFLMLLVLALALGFRQ